MSVVIRLTRGGAKKRAFYRVVAADKRMPRDGRFLDILGFYNPIAVEGEEGTKVDLEKLDKFLSHGAKMSDTVKNLVKAYRKKVQSAPKSD